MDYVFLLTFSMQSLLILQHRLWDFGIINHNGRLEEKWASHLLLEVFLKYPCFYVLHQVIQIKSVALQTEIETWISDSFLVKVIWIEHSKQAHNKNHKHAFKMKQTKRYKNSCYCLSINWQAQKNKTKLNICFSYIAMRLVRVIDKWHPFL